MTIDWTIISTPFNSLNLVSSSTINFVPLAMTTLLAYIITRNTAKLKIVHLPIGLSLWAMDISPGFVPLAIYAIMAAITTFSWAQIADTIRATGTGVTRASYALTYGRKEGARRQEFDKAKETAYRASQLNYYSQKLADKVDQRLVPIKRAALIRENLRKIQSKAQANLAYKDILTLADKKKKYLQGPK
jgi:hypothetical protein